MADRQKKDAQVAFNNYIKNSIKDKDGIVQLMKSYQMAFSKKKQSINNEFSDNGLDPYYDRIIEMYDEAISSVQNIDFPIVKATSSWSYNVDLDSTGITLNLKHLKKCWINDNDIEYVFDITLHTKLVQANFLNVNDYAVSCGVEPVTIRQWIRRGKIRNAIKNGNEWQISELTLPVTTRGYTTARYDWDKDSITFSEEYGELQYWDGVIISQSPRNKQAFLLTSAKNDQGERIEIGKERKENLERYLISHPQVRAFEPYLIPPKEFLDPKDK